MRLCSQTCIRIPPTIYDVCSIASVQDKGCTPGEIPTPSRNTRKEQKVGRGTDQGDRGANHLFFGGLGQLSSTPC